MPKFLNDVRTVFAREIAPELRSPIGLLFAMIQPVLFLVLFGPMLSGADLQQDSSSWRWFVPGILVMMCLFGPLGAGHALMTELSGGQMERFLATPISRVALVAGRTAKDLIVLLIQAVLIIAVAMPLGLNLHLPGALACLGLLAVLGVGLSGFSYLLAIAALPSGNLFWIVTQVFVFPVILLSGVLLPVNAGPGWLETVSAFNPGRYVVDACRALFNGDFLVAAVAQGLLAALLLAFAGVLLATRAMRRGV
ncbi:ABC transporter permease [Kineosporia rhizophila]|uniref:ABC transporter permease n=1 Tax=Kineosporia TaxID=49184 RepID=UPI001E3B030E|nr:ABC transporter permease [Kineosporia sp. NBRC 101677]MCE0539333.1 ABC transporter permease [Kineosporia rhizophila]GLY19916.1 transport permease protein [Kineosporia sp. NBRC 101677]